MSSVITRSAIALVPKRLHSFIAMKAGCPYMSIILSERLAQATKALGGFHQLSTFKLLSISNKAILRSILRQKELLKKSLGSRGLGWGTHQGYRTL